MRICIVTHSLYESDGRVTRYAEALASRGDQVEVFSLRRQGAPTFELINGVQVFRLHTRGFKEKRRASFLKGVLLFFVKAGWLLTKRHLKERYDLIHVNSIPDFLAFLAFVPKLMGCKVILDIHDILPELYASKFGVSNDSLGFKLMLLAERASVAFADHVIVANHIWQERLLSRSLAPRKSTVLLNYPDRSVFKRLRCDRISEEFRIVYPGTLNQHQGLDIAIRAFALIAGKAPKAVFHIHGEGRMCDALAALAAQLGVRERVLFKPMLPIREIAQVMANADLAVVPKRSDSFGDEAFSTKILEFMSVGVPVIVSDTKIDRYYFTPSVVKFFRAGDEEDLAESMLLLIYDENLRQQLVRNACEFVKAFDWTDKKITYLSLVDSLVEGTLGSQTSTWLPQRTCGEAD
jgi:glycosyltransferase involved in cell wall biosynthesis